MKQKIENLKIIPLGGLGEVGRNMMLFEYEEKILIIDMGFRMPEEDMPGIDCIIPNISYLKGKEKNIVGLVITHGHYDHIGAIPYSIEKIGNPQIYTGALARGIILKRQEDFPQSKLKIHTIKNGDRIDLNPFKIEFFKQNHSISDNFGLFISTPVGNIVHTSDFKFDETPVNDIPTDFKKLEELSKRNVLLLLSDSTGAEQEGHSLSEKKIMENLEEIFKNCQGRILAATFASLTNRVQQIITLSERYGRKVAIDGYSMRNNIEICQKLGYIKTKTNTLIRPNQISSFPDSKITFLCTGAQAEGSAVLMRITNGEHKFFKIKKGDSVIFSSSVIPGNERAVQFLKDDLYRQKAIVFHYKMMDIHAGGHAKKEEQAKMIKIIKPKFFMPIHGQYSMLVSHDEIAKSCGIPDKNRIIAENGKIINLNQENIFIDNKEVISNYIMVDGLGIGDVGEVVLRDRQNLAKDGMFVIIVVIDRKTGKIRNSPDIISRGFVYLKESKELLTETRKNIIKIVNNAIGSSGSVNWIYVKDEIRNKLGAFLYKKTERRPMILPVIIEI